MGRGLWIAIAVALIIGGIAGSVAYVLPRLGELQSQTIYATMPGSAVLRLTKAGTYTIYHEHESIVRSGGYNNRLSEGLALRLVSPSGFDVPIAKLTMTRTYVINNRGGAGIYEFSIDAPGNYRLTGTRRGESVQLAIGQGIVGAIFQMIAVVLAIMLSAIGAAITIIVLAMRKRAEAPKPQLPYLN